MNRSRRLLIALVLLLAMPLRAFAATTMPCCPLEPSHAMTTMADDDASMPVVDAHVPPADDAHRPDADAACCVAAMIASSTPVIVPSPAPIATVPDDRYDAVGPFVTDAPERPPRPPLASA